MHRKDRDDTVEVSAVKLNARKPISFIVPVAGSDCLKSSSTPLHYNACDYVLKRLVRLD
jgi:hypothetical protein